MKQFLVNICPVYMSLLCLAFTQSRFEVSRVTLKALGQGGTGLLYETLAFDAAAVKDLLNSTKTAFEATLEMCKKPCVDCAAKKCLKKRTECEAPSSPALTQSISSNLNDEIGSLVVQRSICLLGPHACVVGNILLGGDLVDQLKGVVKVGGVVIDGFVDLTEGLVKAIRSADNIVKGILNPLRPLAGLIGGLEDSIGDILEDVGSIVGGTVDAVGDILRDVGGAVRGAVCGAVRGAEKVIDIAADIGETVVDVIKNVGNVVGNTVRSVGRVVRRLGRVRIRFSRFGRKKRQLADSSPTCFQIINNSTSACLHYISQCPCILEDICPSLVQREAAYLRALNQSLWVQEILNSTDRTYGVTKLTYMYGIDDFNPATGKFNNTEVQVSLFGRQLNFTITKPINFNNPSSAGPVISLQAFKNYRQAVMAEAA